MWWAPGWAALEKESVHVERENVEAEVKVLVHAVVVVLELEAEGFTSVHVPCHSRACP